MNPSDLTLEEFERKNEPANIALTLGFAGLLQLAHEFIKADVLDRPKGFFGYVEWDNKHVWSFDDDGEEYQRNVRALSPGNPFSASLLWLQKMDALTADDAARLAKVKEHRDELTHGLAPYLLMPGYEVEPRVLTDAIEVFAKLNRFWISIDFDLGTFEEHPGATVDDVLTGPAMVLSAAVNAFYEVHLPDASGN
jgi:hypothetical protein